MREVAGIIVAGGRATRMGGRDKAFLVVGGETIAARTVRLFRSLFPQVVAVTNSAPERFSALGAETTADRFPGCGPLAGIHAGLSVCRFPHAFVAACDMPGLHPAVIGFLLERIGDHDAVVPEWDGDIEPLHAIYARRCLPLVEECLRGGRHTIREFLPLVKVAYIPAAELARVEGAEASFRNVNTMEELRAVGGEVCPPAPRG